MSTEEKYPCYINIQDEVTEDSVELPSLKDGTISLTSVASQFPGTVGLRFKSENGTWRGVCLTDENNFDVPLEGWGKAIYHVVKPERATSAPKRKIQLDESEEDEEEELSPLEKMKRMTEEEMLSDLVLLNIPYQADEEEVKTYFETFGEVRSLVIKRDKDNKHRGFGFMSFKTVEAVEKCFSVEMHKIRGREVQVCLRGKNHSKHNPRTSPAKLFVGKVPKDTSVEELTAYFEKFGEVKNCYLPTPFKGYGFVTFKKSSSAKIALKAQHFLKGQHLNVNHPNSKNDKSGGGNSQIVNPGFGGGGDFGDMYNNPVFQAMLNMQGMLRMNGIQGVFPGGMQNRNNPGKGPSTK